uniref:Cathepsin H n=1 Tax=Crocodylus porosus TaxID=8502 RepID=A0A7M4FRV8_CROPO
MLGPSASDRSITETSALEGVQKDLPGCAPVRCPGLSIPPQHGPPWGLSTAQGRDPRTHSLFALHTVLILGARPPGLSWDVAPVARSRCFPAGRCRARCRPRLSSMFPPFLQNCSATRGNLPRSSGPCPSAIDWRKKGNYVTPVKNQGSCGSCWTFSTTGCLESAIAIKTGKLLMLSEQQLVDCAQNFNNHGCSGGLPSQAFEYILYNKGLMGEDTYPYRAENGTCKFQPDKAIAFVKEVVNITLYDEQGMMEAVGTHNPVSFAFQVTEDFMQYSKGVYTNPHCEKTPDKVNHAVLAVGYGVENGMPYWIVKNSWGTYWGMDGYFHIERGKNMCGLADCASYPIPWL